MLHILSQPGSLENTSKILSAITKEQERRLNMEGYIVKYHMRGIDCRNSTLTVQIPEIWLADEKDAPHMCIYPEYLLAHGRKPIQAYIYAIYEYCKNQQKASQRKAAAKAAQLFGLLKFAHTTLGRVLKKLVAVVGDIEESDTDSPGCGAPEAGGAKFEPRECASFFSASGCPCISRQGTGLKPQAI